MKKLIIVAASLSALGLAACDTPAEDVQEQQLESQEDILEEKADMADDMGMEAEADSLDAQADAMGDAADQVDGTDIVSDEALTDDDMETTDEM